jgi:hypothetical protein
VLAFHQRWNPSPFGSVLLACQAQVRFFALPRIKPHPPPLVRVPVNSFEFHPCEHTPQAVHLTGYLRHVSKTHAKCTSFTAGTTGVSNPVRSPSFRVSVSGQVDRNPKIKINKLHIRGTYQRAAFAIGIPRDIHAFYRYTASSTLPSCPLSR